MLKKNGINFDYFLAQRRAKKKPRRTYIWAKLNLNLAAKVHKFSKLFHLSTSTTRQTLCISGTLNVHDFRFYFLFIAQIPIRQKSQQKNCVHPSSVIMIIECVQALGDSEQVESSRLPATEICYIKSEWITVAASCFVFQFPNRWNLCREKKKKRTNEKFYALLLRNILASFGIGMGHCNRALLVRLWNVHWIVLLLAYTCYRKRAQLSWHLLSFPPKALLTCPIQFARWLFGTRICSLLLVFHAPI